MNTKNKLKRRKVLAMEMIPQAIKSGILLAMKKLKNKNHSKLLA